MMEGKEQKRVEEREELKKEGEKKGERERKGGEMAEVMKSNDKI